ERREEPWRDRAEPCARIRFAVLLAVTRDRELESRSERPGIAPRHDGADRHALDARQFPDAAQGFLVEHRKLLRRALVRHDGYVQCEHVTHVEAGSRRL